MAVGQGPGDKEDNVFRKIAELHIKEVGAHGPGDADEERDEGRSADHSPDNGGSRERFRTRNGAGKDAPARINDAKEKQRHTEPERAGTGEEMAADDIVGISAGEAIAGIPYAGGIITGQRLDQEDKEERRKPQPVSPVAEETDGS